MGYNNHHAGMHMVWHRRYAAYDDLEYYDKLAAEQRKKELALRKREEAIMHTEDKKVEKKNTGKTNKNNKNANANHTLDMPKIPYGNEKVIDIQYFDKMDIISKNVMILALKNKVDIGRILSEIEDLMKKDERTNGKPAINNSWSWMPMLEKSMIFLSLLADKLNCTIQEFFMDDSAYRKRFVYKLLDNIKDYEWDEGYIDAESGNAEICIQYYGENVSVNMDIFHPSMDLTLYREYDDGIPYYSLAYGDLSVRALSMYDYLIKGAYLLEEEDGKLKDLAERLIAEHPEWVEE